MQKGRKTKSYLTIIGKEGQKTQKAHHQTLLTSFAVMESDKEEENNAGNKNVALKSWRKQILWAGSIPWRQDEER